MNGNYKSIGASAALLMLILTISGCASLPCAYVPTQLGVIPGCAPTNGLVMTLKPDRNIAKIGDLLSFNISIKNLGSRTVWLPREPDILLLWVYPDGRCDNFVRDPVAPPAHVAMTALAPGEERRFTTSMATHYFERIGITEFRASMTVPERQTTGDQLVWAGEIASNGYGVMFAN